MKPYYVYIALVIALIVGLIIIRNASDTERIERITAYDSFAQCIADAGAKFYGAYWCPHCQNQKRMFQNSTKVPYVECSTPNGQGQLPICVEAGITGYPTWTFADDSRLDGERTLEELGEKTNCEVPSV